MPLRKLARNLVISWIALFFLASPVLGARLAYANKLDGIGAAAAASAKVGAGLPVTDFGAAMDRVSTSIKEFISNTMQVAIFTALINTLTFTADRLAYDAAVKIATGGAGGTPLFDGTPTGEYMGLLAKDIAGEFIGELSDVIDESGGLLSNFNLCAPSSPYILLQFKLGIKGVFERPEPECDFNKMFGPEGTWASFVAELEGYDTPFKSKLILAQLANMYDPQKNEFSAGLNLYTDLFGKTTLLPLILAGEHADNDGFADVVDVITGNVQTPADQIKDLYFKYQADTTEERKDILKIIMSRPGTLLEQVGLHAGSVFSNTLLSKLQERIWTGMFDFDETLVDPFDPNNFAVETTEGAAERYRSLFTVAPFQISDYSILSEFATCPGTNLRGLYNCVADSNLVSAVARAEAGAALTIAEAVDEGMLRGDWPLIPASDVARNQDAYCYTYGYCYANLVKLRKARVISIGWEMAANSSANAPESPVTLQEVLDGFGNCGPNGLPDENHPWCNMIDPQWVLKYPETQCRMQAYGEVLLADQSSERQSTCVDMPSCIAEDANGNCVGGYGYCVAEENTWNFRGESCPEYAASCLDMEDSSGESIALLRNTVDPGPCTEDTVGCRWYSAVKEEQTDGTFAFAAISDISAQDASTTAYADRIYFNNQVETCSEENGGCATLVARDTELRLNMVFNAGFEQDDDSDDLPDGWYNDPSVSARAVIASEGDVARSGDVAVSPGSGVWYQPGIELGQARTYTLSFYARQEEDGASDTATAILDVHDEYGGTVDFTGLATVGDCTARASGMSIAGVVPEGAGYERFVCTFTVPPLTDRSARLYADLSFTAFDGYVDSIQLEQGEDASSSTEGYSDEDLSTLIAKVPPAYLGCTGSSDDPAACDDYAQVCTEQDVGCTLYTPTNGDPALSGIATELDACPAECVGYDTYRQEATRYEPEGVDVVYFIPDTATECSADEVGCDEFTNLSTEEQEYFTFLRACVTPEQASTNISSDNEATFYTWEGSDAEGYQLQTWTLLESNAGSSDYAHMGSDGVTDSAPNEAPCAQWTATEEGIVCNDTQDENGDGYYDWDTENCNNREDIFSNADCREFYDANGNIHYREWTKTVSVAESCTTYRKTVIAGDTSAEREATCEDSGGFFASETGDCRYFGHPTESVSCDESANGCRAYAGGRSRNSRMVFEELFESGTLNAWDSESASFATYSNESLASGGHSMRITDIVQTFVVNNGEVCTDAGGCDGTAESFGGTCTVDEGEEYCGTLEGELYVGKTYTLSIVAKGTGTLTAGFDFATEPGNGELDVTFGTEIALEDGWTQYTLGPLYMDADEYPLFGSGTSLTFRPTGSAYIDTIVLREGEENITVIRDSWVTPASCDQTPMGTESPQYMLGCQEYATQDGDTAYVKSFSSLCDEDKIGCDAFFATQESESTAAYTWNATCTNPTDSDADGMPDAVTSPTACYYFTDTSGFDEDSPYLCTISAGQSSCLFSQDGFTPAWMLPDHLAYAPGATIVPADRDVFLVVTDDVTCSQNTNGCTELGDPMWSQDRNSTAGAESVFLRNLPDTYAQTLCAHEELFCDGFTTSEAETLYFKHPLEQTCEYRTDVSIDGVAYTGWFREGTEEFCYGTCEDGAGNEGASCGSSADCAGGETCNSENPSYVIGGTESGIWNNGDVGFSGWAGACSAAHDTCTEFQDPLAQEEGDVYTRDGGTSHFYLNNETLDESSLVESQRCNGEVSLKNGCAMFYDTANTSLTANASATETASRHADVLFDTETYGLVDPINCAEGGNSTVTTADGTIIDLCATRCVYDYGKAYELSDGVSYVDKLSQERTSGADYDRDDMYLFGTSCYEVQDCSPIATEAGDRIEAVACASQVRTGSGALGSYDAWMGSGTPGFTDVPRLENDVNTVLKVNRDRQCAEWLACTNSQTQWDEATASFVTTCNDIALCTDYDAASGSSFCSNWNFSKPDVVLSEDWYASRDTSWYGSDYSGMAIPNTFPVQSLSQADVRPLGYCAIGGGNTCTVIGGTSECAADSVCLSYDEAVAAGLDVDSVNDYALVLNAGACNEEYGNSCAVGVCEDTGAACASSDACTGGGACIVGSCYDIDTSDAGLCQDISDCDEGQVCYGGACATVGATIAIEDYEPADRSSSECGAGETFVSGTTLKTGSCINEQCLLAPNGEQFVNSETEGKICRAYPESTSPFPTSVVSSWYDPEDPGNTEDATDLTEDDLPYGTISGFENVETCAYGQNCDCSYARVTFGGGADTRYYEQDWDVSAIWNITREPCDVEDINATRLTDTSGVYESCVATANGIGVCVGGDTEGAYCVSDENCGAEGTNAECAFKTREDVLYGMNGFCLEKDTSMNKLGDREQSACLTWLPVDELAGDTDLQAKYLTAGYFEDTYACTDIALYVDMGTSLIPEEGPYEVGDIACGKALSSSIDRGEVFTNEVISACDDHASCPSGYWMLLGMPSYKNGTGDLGAMADACTDPSGEAGGEGSNNDCPYVCIPKGAIAENGSSCNPEDADGAPQAMLEEFSASTGETVDFAKGDIVGANTYVLGGGLGGTDRGSAEELAIYRLFDRMALALTTCSVRGVEYSADLVSETGVNMYRYAEGEYGSLHIQGEPFVGCKDVTQVASAVDYESYAWTDRILGSDTGAINGYGYDVLGYSQATTPTPFGFSSINPQSGESVFAVAMCYDEANTMYYPPNGASSAFNVCTDGYVVDEDVLYTDPADAEARSFEWFSFDFDLAKWGDSLASLFSTEGTLSNATNRINEVFASTDIHMTSGLFAWNGASWTSGGGGALGYEGEEVPDTTGKRDEGTPPKVWSVDVGSCSDDGQYCEEGIEGRITVNSSDTGVQTGNVFFNATVKFYAAADKNQLPLRRVIVDWGDDADGSGGFSGSDATDNFFKNARGLQEGTQKSKCELGTEWGLTSESCDPYYFTYNHIYTCSAEVLADDSLACGPQNADGTYSQSPCWLDQSGDGTPDACAFTPRIHVRDNWGWCTGTCTAGVDGTTGCFDGDAYGIASEVAPNDQCDYEVDYSTAGNVPFASYYGSIIVTP